MSTLRINNIEAQSVPASPTIDEKVKVTNSSGDILVNIDGKTSGITTIGINTTDGNIKFDANSNVLITGILTATTLAGNFTPDSLEIGSNIKLGNAGVITATSFVGSGAQLTGITGTTINTNADNRIITGSGTANTLNGEANFTYDGTNLRLGTTTAAIGGGTGIMVASSTGARIKLCDSDAGVTANDGFEIIAGNGGTGYINNKENQAIVISTNNTERMRITHEGSVGIGTDNSTYELHVEDDTGAAALRMKDGANNVICDLIANSTGGLLRTVYNHPLVFHTNQVERMRINHNGNIGINETSPQRYLHITGNDGTTGASSGNSDTQLVIENAGGNGAMIEFLSSNTGAGRIFFTDSDSSNQGGIEYFHSSDHFQVSAATSNQGLMALHLRKQNAASNVQSDMIAFDVGGSGRGKIVSAPSGSSNPQFSTYSDRRLKTNFRDYTGGYDRIKSIPVKLYDEVLNDQTKSVFGDNVKTDVVGWIADEVQLVFPDAVMGTKDEVDSDGKPVYQSLTEGTFLPDAIQAIQKLIQKVETLEAKVSALEGS